MNYELIVKILLFTIIVLMCIGIMSILYQQESSYLIERLKKGHSTKKQKSIFDDLLKIIKPVTAANMKTNKNKNEVKEMFIRLGMAASENDVIDFENRRMLRFILALLFSVIFSFIYLVLTGENSTKWLMAAVMILGACFYGYLGPVWKLRKQIKKKERAFDKFFPDAIDLLCVCVEAGLGIDSAIERVGREFSYFSPEVGGEFNRVAKDILSGVSKQDALRGLSQRVKNRDIQAFIAIIIQADKMGASIASSLSISADSLRTKRKQRLEAQVSAASTKMTIPLVLCLLPATFAVVLTPAIIQVIENLGKMYGFK